jgi:hypothetical protein
VRQQRLASNLMKNFCAFGPKPGAFARRHDHNGKFVRGDWLFFLGHEWLILNGKAAGRKSACNEEC